MFRSSRIRLGAALAVVLAAAPTARSAEPDKLLPADSELVAYVNVRQIIESEIIKKYALEQMKQTLQGNDAQKFLKELGLDPLKDVDKVVIGMSGTPGNPNDARGLLIVRGKFDPDKLYKAAEAQTKKDGDRFSLIKDGQDVMFKYQPDTGNPVFGTVVDDGAVVLGTEKKIISAALKAATANRKPALKGEVATLVGRMDDKASMWVVALTKDKLDKLPLPMGGPGADFAKQLPNLDNVTMVLRVTTDVSLDVGLGLKDEASADDMIKQLDDLLGQAKGFLAFAAGDPKMKPLADFVKSIKTGVKGKTITISAKMPGDAIGKLINQGD
jgi:hypothetical protein